MKNLRSLALLAVALLSGCAADGADTTTDVDGASTSRAPVFVGKAVNVDQRFSDAVKVEKDALVIPTSMLGKIEIGSIIAGDRSSKPGNDNPFGFLRRVTDIEKSGKQTTLVTQRAELAEWIEDGRIDFGSRRSIFSGAKLGDGSIVTKTLHLQGNDQEASGSGEQSAPLTGNLKDTISIENVTFSIGASYDGYIDVHKKWGKIPTGFKMKSQLTLTPSVGAEIVWKISNSASVEGSLSGGEVLIPLTAPIPVTIRYTPELKCNLSASGEAKMRIGANIKATAVLGFEMKGGLTDLPDPTNLSEAPTADGNLQLIDLTGKATVSTECEVVGNVDLLAFDAIGMSGRLGPWVNLTANMCAQANAAGVDAGFTLQESHGFTETFNGKVQVPVVGASKDFELWSGKQTIGEGYLKGDESTCDLPTVDSCAGKVDGFHCSEVEKYSGIVCENGQILKGIQCDDMSLTCTGGDHDHITCQ